MISPDEIQKIVDHCMDARDKSLFSTMYDSGIRHGKLLLMRNKHLNFDNYGAILKVPLEGKTGYRQVRVVGMSVPYLREWQNAHPKRDDPDAHLFCGLETQNYGDKLEYNHTYKSLKTALKRAGIIDLV